MGALTSNTIATTYQQLLKITSQGVGADDSAKYVEDGLGTDTALSLSTTRVGIGTVSPLRPLSVSYPAAKTSTSTAYAMSIQSNESANQAALQFYAVGGASAAVRKWQLQTTEVGVANAGIIEFQPDGGTINFVGAPTFNTDIQINDAHPGILFTDTDDNSDSRIYHSAGGLYIDADNNGEVADSKVRFSVDDAQKFVINANSIISLSNNDNGTSNTIFGDSAADSLDAGSNFNVFIGKSVATGSTDDASDNVAIGFESMKAIIQGDDNVALGMRTLLDLEDGSNNTAIGDSVLRSCVDASDNTAVGAYAMDATTTGNNNVAVGKNALGNTADVDRCVAIGSAALSQSNITSAADGAVAVGYFALGNLTTGARNTALGYNAMITHTTGHSNIAIGYGAMDDTDAGATAADSDDNIFIGYNAGGGTWADTKSETNVAIGNYSMAGSLNAAGTNTCVGYGTGENIVGGSSNVLMGHNAGNSIGSGSNNICLGYQAGTNTVALSTGDNNVVIGRNAHTSANSASNQIVIGQDVAGNADNSFCFGAASTDSAIAFGATSISAPSDVRMKRNIKDSGAGLSFINDLRPVTFEWKKEKDIPEELNSHIANSEKVYKNDKVNHGFIAQEVKECIDSHSEIKNGFDMWSKDDSDGRQRVAENALVPVLVKAVQELTAKVEELETKLNNKES